MSLLHDRGFHVLSYKEPYYWIRKDRKSAQDYLSKKDSICAGGGAYTKGDKIRWIRTKQIKKAEAAKAAIKNMPYTMPTTFRVKSRGKLVPLRPRARKR